MKKYWTDYLPDFDSFTFYADVPVNNENYLQSVNQIDEVILMSGLKHKIFYFKEKYNTEAGIKMLLEKKQAFIQEGGIVKVAAFDEFIRDEYYISLPYDGQYVDTAYRKPFIPIKIIDIDTHNHIFLIDYKGETEWLATLSFSIGSCSNIWWKEIGISRNEDDWTTVLFEPPVDNSATAYRVVPRFNSFLRDIINLVESLGGKITLEEYNKKYVTAKGILLDGTIWYQEDIESGKVNLPC